MDTLHVEEAVEELMKQNDGVNPNSSIPVEQQLESKRIEYRKLLEFAPIKTRVTRAMELVEGVIKEKLDTDAYEELVVELADAADALVESPENQGKKLGISQKNLDLLFTFAQNKLDESAYSDAAALLTLLTVLDRSLFKYWFFLGAALQEQHDLNEALDAYRQASEIAHEDPLVHIFSAECYAELNDMQNAHLHLNKAKVCMQGFEPHSSWQERIVALEAKLM